MFYAVTVLIAAQEVPALAVLASDLNGSIQRGLALLSHHGKVHKSAERCRTALTAVYKQPATDQLSNHVPTEHNSETENFSQQTRQTDGTSASAIFDWDLEGLPDLIEGEGMEWLMFNPNMFEWNQDGQNANMFE